MAIPHPTSPGEHTMRRRRTLADLDIPDRGNSASPHSAPADSYASSTGLDEAAAEKSPLSPRLSLRAEIEDRGKPPRGRAIDRTPPPESRSKRRRRLTEFTQDKLLPQEYVSKRTRWISVLLVWLAIICAIVVAVWLRLASISGEDDGIDATDDSHDTRTMPWENNDAWQKVAVSQVFGVGDSGTTQAAGGDGWSDKGVF